MGNELTSQDHDRHSPQGYGHLHQTSGRGVIGSNRVGLLWTASKGRIQLCSTIWMCLGSTIELYMHSALHPFACRAHLSTDCRAIRPVNLAHRHLKVQAWASSEVISDNHFPSSFSITSSVRPASGSKDGPEVAVRLGGRERDKWIWFDGNFRAVSVSDQLIAAASLAYNSLHTAPLKS
jgi:hypothetical protein